MGDKIIPMKDQNALVLGDGQVYKIQKVRQRKIHSCVPCHQRKVKCSREMPTCANCAKNQLECKYFVNDRVSRGKKLSADEDKKADQQKKHQLKTFIEKAKILQSSTSSGATASSGTPVVSTVVPSSSTSPPAPATAATDLSSDCISNESTSPPKIHTTTINYDAGSGTSSSSTALGSNSFTNFSSIYYQNSISPQLFQQLPTKQRSYTLVKRFISTIHPILPILDINEFLNDHDLFWNNKLLNPNLFLTTLFPILFSASKAECFQFSYDEVTKFELSSEIHRYKDSAELALHLINYPKNYSIKILQGATLLQSTVENPSITQVATLIRISQIIHLHRDPTSFHNITTPSLVQLRRLLWWQIFYLDAITSLNHFVTPMIKLDEFDTSLPLEFSNNVINVETCFLNGKFRFSIILNELTKNIYGLSILPFNTIELLKQKIIDLNISCNASILNLSTVISNDLSASETNFLNWSKYILNSYTDRALLLLQKKIILSKDSVISTSSTGNGTGNGSDNDSSTGSSNNDYKAKPQQQFYSYGDLSSNLIPCALHYINEFLTHNNNDVYNCYNWEIRNSLPLDAITILMKSLVQDLNNINDIRFYMVDKSLDLIFIKFDNKKKSVFKNSITLMRYLFQIISLKRQGSISSTVVPKPSTKIVAQPDSYLDSFKTTTSCSQIAPRTIKAEAANFNYQSEMFAADLFPQAPFFPKQSAAGDDEPVQLDQQQQQHRLDEQNIDSLLATIKLQVQKFLNEERIVDDEYAGCYYLDIENEITDMIESLLS